jgi:hypothetical protein
MRGRDDDSRVNVESCGAGRSRRFEDGAVGDGAARDLNARINRFGRGTVRLAAVERRKA